MQPLNLTIALNDAHHYEGDHRINLIIAKASMPNFEEKRGRERSMFT